MFCFQCQETAKNTGCTVRGVCGKIAEVANLQYALIYVCKGIGYWASKGRPLGIIEKKADHFVTKSLFATITNANFDDAYFMGKIKEGFALRDGLKAAFLKKYKETKGKDFTDATPDAATWYAEPDKDVYTKKGYESCPLATENEDIRSLKEFITYGIKGMCAYADHALALGYEDPLIWGYIHEALAMTLDINQTVDFLVQWVMKTGDFGVKTMALIDKANTDTYGKPTPTQVFLGVKPGPGILVSGHDLRDLHELLEQTKGKGINIYTHGEMLPANSYPKLNSYSHLVGNYGSSWWHQNTDFETFNGPILLTTNCLIPPKNSYLDRLYTTNNVGWPNVPHISENPTGGPKDFSAIIERALKTDTPKELENKSITIGFHHSAILENAPKILDLINQGKLKRFVVMGGCDGRMKSREYFTQVAEKLPKDTIILTAGCAKYRYNKLDLGDIDGIPRVLDAGQCNDSYSLAVVALKLKEVLGLKDVNELPLSFDLAWYEQKAVLVLIVLLYLGFKKIHLGPTIPGFASPNIVKFLVETFQLQPTTDPDSDIQKIMEGN